MKATNERARSQVDERRDGAVGLECALTSPNKALESCEGSRAMFVMSCKAGVETEFRVLFLR